MRFLGFDFFSRPYITIYNYFGLCNDVITHPDNYASYAVPIRWYRYLQSRLLQI